MLKLARVEERLGPVNRVTGKQAADQTGTVTLSGYLFASEVAL